jgi:hypothetical protein
MKLYSFRKKNKTTVKILKMVALYFIDTTRRTHSESACSFPGEAWKWSRPPGEV